MSIKGDQQITNYKLNLQKSTIYLATESESFSVMSDSLWLHGYIVHGILQARKLEWVAVPFSKGSSQPRDLPNPGIEPRSSTLQMDSLPAEPQGKPIWFTAVSPIIPIVSVQ